MTPLMKGILGFVGCAGVCGAAYAIGKHVGREETLKEVELEELRMAVKKPVEPAKTENDTKTDTTESTEVKNEQATSVQPIVTPSENVRKKHGIKNKLFGGVGMIKDILGGNTEDKKLTMTVEDGDIVARISQKQGG